MVGEGAGDAACGDDNGDGSSDGVDVGKGGAGDYGNDNRGVSE